ncbi:MAG: hypothetical protein R3B70_26390 [Polyangiaceae bacterium]
MSTVLCSSPGAVSFGHSTGREVVSPWFPGSMSAPGPGSGGEIVVTSITMSSARNETNCAVTWTLPPLNTVCSNRMSRTNTGRNGDRMLAAATGSLTISI